MKKLILFFLLSTIAMMGAKAQLGGGFDSAFNLGGGGSTIDAITQTSAGDTYFVATVKGKVFFGGQEVDGGQVSSFALEKKLFGKVSSTGTQTLLKVLDYNGKDVMINSSGELYILTVGVNPLYPKDFGNGVVNDSPGYFLIKIDNAGVAQWKKSVDTGSDYEYGKNTSNAPTLFGMQFTPNGDLYIFINGALGEARNPPSANFKYPARAIKFDSNGNEVWHNEMFGTNTFAGGDKLNQFVSDDGRMTFNVMSSNYSTTNLYFEGQDVTSQISNYDGTNGVGYLTISLKPDGTKNFFVADTYGGTTVKAVNPSTGDLYIKYYNFSKKFPATAPYNTFPNQYSPLNPTQYLFTGTMTFSNTGQYQGVVTDAIISYDKLFSTGSGFVGLSGSVDKGDYTISSTAGVLGALSYYDASFQFIKAIKTPPINVFTVSGNKTVIGGSFTGSYTLGSKTLVQSDYDTGYQSRFGSAPSSDVFMAKIDANNITVPAYTNWLGVDNNWNNVANWSLGYVPTAESLVKFNANTANMPTTGTTPKALKVIIDAGVIAELPTNLQVGNKVIINGKLQINHTGALSFSGYSPGKVEGTGTIAFNGSNTPSVNTTGYFSGLTLETNEDIYFLYPPTLNKLKFTGTSSIIKTNGNNFEITSPDEDAITGYGETNLIEGGLTRAVNPTGTYVFPGSPLNLTYEPAILTLNNLQGVQKIKAEFKLSVSAPDYKFPDGSICKVALGYSSGSDFSYGNSVKFSGDAVPTGGNYNTTLQRSTFNNGVLDANKERYVVLTDGKFQGSKLASTQTGGTVNGQVVSNATVIAGVSDLSKFGEFLIGVNSGIVSVGTAVTTATWTGGVSGDWNTAGNWSTGIVPNGLTDVTIPVSTVYPSIYSTTDFVNSLMINSGVVDMSLSHILATNLGLTNNGDIKIEKLAGANTAYVGNILGTGKARFEANSGLTKVNMNTSNNVEVNVGDANNLEVTGKFSGNFNVKSGKITYSFPSGAFEITNPNAVVQITAPINGISNDSYIQTVNTNGTYFFPLISSTKNQSATRNYGGMTIKNNGIAATTKKYTARFETHFKVPVSIVSGSDFYNDFLNSGQWYITPDAVSTTGTIDVSFTTSGYSNGGRANVSDYVLLRRGTNSTSVDTYFPWQAVSGAVITESAGTLTATVNGIPAINTVGVTFCIGLKAGITTWTGATDANWNVATNWSNGLPSATLKAVIGNASVYPSNPPTTGTNQPGLLEIAGGSVVSLPATFSAPKGIVNNGTINVSGSGTFYGFGSGSAFSTVSGIGKLVFGSGSPTTFDSYYMNQTLNNTLELNNPSGLTITRTTSFGGDVNLINGKVTMAANQVFNITNPNATVSGTSTAYIVGQLNRNVNPSGTYNFPVGISTAYTPASLTLSGLVGVTAINTNFSTAAISGQPNLTIGTQTVTNVLSGGSWFITPNAQPTAGTYTATLSAPLGSSTANNFYVLKRPGNYGSWTNSGTNAPSTITAGVVTASVSGLTSFSQFGIGEGVGALPVKMVKFLASADAKTAKLYWETASELNNDKFEIERSTNGTDFIKIGEVKGNGTSQKLNVYSFRDLAPANGVSYYRLKQLDLNGNFEYSETKFVSFDFKEVLFSIYPNPATEVINFNQAVKAVNIYNLQGALLLQQNGTVSSVKIPNSFVKGLYLVKVKLGNGSLVTKQILINK